MAKPNFTLPNKPAIKSGSILSYNYTDDFTFVPAPLTFNRDSAATIVNEKGLIEDVGYFGPELVQNGDFSEIGPDLVINGDFATNSDWNLGSGQWTILNGFAVADNASNNLHTSNAVATATGLQYKVTFTLQDVAQGYVNVGLSNLNSTQFNSDGTHTLYIESSGNRFLYFRPVGFTGKLTNVSVKEVGQNWTFGTGWGIAEINGNQVAEFDGGADAAIQQVSILTSGKKYRLSIDVANKTTGSLQIRFGNTGVVDETITTNGTFTYDLVSDGSTLYLRSISGFDGYIDNVSVIEVLGDKPRIDYSDSLTEPFLLLEPQSTNLLTFSEDFSDSSWFLYGTIQANSSSSPKGLTNATKLTHTHQTFNMLRVSVGGLRVTSVFVKNIDANNFYIRKSGGSYAYYNFDTKTVNDNSLKVEYFLNDWIRLSLATDETPYRQFGIGQREIDSSEVGNSVYVWGAQLEELSYATSYIPTFGSAATRLGETANNAGDVNVFNSEEGVLYAEIAGLSDASGNRTLSISDGTNNNSVVIRYTTTTNKIQAFVFSGGVTQFSSDANGLNILNYNKVAISYKLNNVVLWVNGTKISTDTSATMPLNLSEFNFTRGDGANNFYGKTKNLQVFNKALTDRELEILTIQ